MDRVEKPISVKLLRELDAAECEERNALSDKIPGYMLAAGQVGEVVDTLENGAAYLVEFGNSGPNSCDWLGVLYVAEVELRADEAVAA